jgi:hypothetical protein
LIGSLSSRPIAMQVSRPAGVEDRSTDQLDDQKLFLQELLGRYLAVR